MDINIKIELDEKSRQLITALMNALNGGTAENHKDAPSEYYARKMGENAPSRSKEEKVKQILENKETNAGKPVSDRDNTSSDVRETENEVVSIENLRGLTADVKDKLGTAAPIKALLKEYGAKMLSEISNDKTAEFAQRLKELLNA